jgi:hypothetical protein
MNKKKVHMKGRQKMHLRRNDNPNLNIQPLTPSAQHPRRRTEHLLHRPLVDVRVEPDVEARDALDGRDERGRAEPRVEVRVIVGRNVFDRSRKCEEGGWYWWGVEGGEVGDEGGWDGWCCCHSCGGGRRSGVLVGDGDTKRMVFSQ